MPQKLWVTLSETAKYKIFCFYLFRGYSSTSVRLNSTGNKHSINVEFNFPMYSWKMCFPLNSSTLQWNHVFHKLCGKLFSTVVQCWWINGKYIFHKFCGIQISRIKQYCSGIQFSTEFMENNIPVEFYLSFLDEFTLKRRLFTLISQHCNFVKNISKRL